MELLPTWRSLKPEVTPKIMYAFSLRSAESRMFVVFAAWCYCCLCKLHHHRNGDNAAKIFHTHYSLFDSIC